jgi:aminopeptidase YwaD
MSRRIWSLTLVLAALTALPRAQPAAPRHQAESVFAAAVNEQRLREAVKELVALGPRMGGTPSGDGAAASLEKAFGEAGLAARVVSDPPLLAHWEESWRLELGGGRVETAWPFGYSPSVEPVEAPLLFLEDLAAAKPGPEWRGKVIYTRSSVGRAYSAIARNSHRPVAIVTSHPSTPDKYVDAARLGSLPARTDNPVAVFAVSYRDGQALEAAAARGEPVGVALESRVAKGEPRTVIATLEGRQPDRYYLICAHGDSDSGGPGADDNASGVATVLEIARVYASLITAGQLARPEVSLRFAIWGTEYHSTKAYVTREGAALDRLAGVINFDETGTGAERETIYFESNDVPWNAPLLRTLAQVGADYRGKPGFWPEYETNPSQGGTDSYVFLPRQHRGTGDTTLRIPSTTIYTAAWDGLETLQQTKGWETPGSPHPAQVKVDYSRYYHSSGDTPENTTEREPQNMVRAVKAAGIGLLRLAFSR